MQLISTKLTLWDDQYLTQSKVPPFDFVKGRDGQKTVYLINYKLIKPESGFPCKGQWSIQNKDDQNILYCKLKGG